MGKIVAIANQKGGVGKTTTAFNLGVALSKLGYRVLLVDFDPQASLTLCCGNDPDSLDVSIYDCLLHRMSSDEVLKPTNLGPDLLPSNIDLSVAEVELVNAVARERRLSAVLTPLRDTYDFIIIDCCPSLGLLTQNALGVSDSVIIPIACEYLALRGVKVLLRVIGKIRLQLNSRLRVDGLLPTMYDRRTRHARDVLSEIRGAFGNNIHVYEHVVHRSIRFAEAAMAGQAIFSYAGEVPGAGAYLELAKEVALEARTRI